MKYVLWRILGNDLPPRHPPDQTVANLEFIVEHEKNFEDCDKRFVLNRIVDKTKEAEIAEYLYKHNYDFIQIPFIRSEYHSKVTVPEKIDYVTNVNGARNQVLDVSSKLFKYDVVLPMDGGMYFREDGWQQFRDIVEDNPKDGFFAFPTWRVENHQQVLTTEVAPNLISNYWFGAEIQKGSTELQLAFTQHRDTEFSKNHYYGFVDKVELLWRLGLEGLWSRWEPRERRKALSNPSKFSGNVKMAGFVCRLPSGNHEADFNNAVRGKQRWEGVFGLLQKLDNLPE